MIKEPPPLPTKKERVVLFNSLFFFTEMQKFGKRRFQPEDLIVQGKGRCVGPVHHLRRQKRQMDEPALPFRIVGGYLLHDPVKKMVADKGSSGIADGCRNPRHPHRLRHLFDGEIAPSPPGVMERS